MNKIRRNSPLSGREFQILKLVALGYSDKAIASLLQLSERTINGHTGAVLRKLGARNRAHAVLRAFQCGTLQLAEFPPTSVYTARSHSSPIASPSV